MLVIKIELWPGGCEELSYEIHRGYIWNDGSGDIEKGNYKAEFLKRNSTKKGSNVWKKSTLINFPRTKLLAWDLLSLLLVKGLGRDRFDTYRKHKVDMNQSEETE